MNELNEKVIRYEAFINEQLKGDCRKLYEKEGVLLEERSEFEVLLSHLQRIQKNQLASLDVSVDLGSSCFCDAHVADPSKVFVDIGLGVHVELSIEEASGFSKQKISGINEHIKKIDEQISVIKAQIKLVTEGIRELLNI